MSDNFQSLKQSLETPAPSALKHSAVLIWILRKAVEGAPAKYIAKTTCSSAPRCGLNSAST